MKKEKEKKWNNSVKWKWERVMSLLLAIIMVAYVVNFSGAINVSAETLDPEASVTDSNNAVIYYNTLEEAITAAQGMSGSTVKLLADATTASTVEISSGTFTIDLNGKTWTCTGGLYLQYGSNITLKDSAGSGIMTRASSITIFVKNAILTIESGTYKNTSYQPFGGIPTSVLFANCGGAGSVTIQGGSFKSNDPIGRVAYFQQASVDISGGAFSDNSVFFESCQSVDLSGGSYDDISVTGSNVAALLSSSYGYKYVSGGTWVNNTSDSLSKVTVQPVPVQITAQPQGGLSETYGYTSSPTLSVTACNICTNYFQQHESG